jgi:hypothetical protein
MYRDIIETVEPPSERGACSKNYYKLRGENGGTFLDDCKAKISKEIEEERHKYYALNPESIENGGFLLTETNSLVIVSNKTDDLSDLNDLN